MGEQLQPSVYRRSYNTHFCIYMAFMRWTYTSECAAAQCNVRDFLLRYKWVWNSSLRLRLNKGIPPNIQTACFIVRYSHKKMGMTAKMKMKARIVVTSYVLWWYLPKLTETVYRWLVCNMPKMMIVIDIYVQGLNSAFRLTNYCLFWLYRGTTPHSNIISWK